MNQNETDSGGTTHFGFEKVATGEKAGRVSEVFDTVADRYDFMNDLMSLGVHRLWKRFTVFLTALRPGHKVLDLAGGTADLTRLLLDKVGEQGEIWLADYNGAMLCHGRDRLIDEGVGRTVHYVQANGECLPLPDNYFHAITLAFGLRNMTHLDQALAECYRVLKPGGQLLVLEFSKVHNPILSKLYDVYSYEVLPRLGKWITGSSDSYRYLAESIRMHPDQEQLKQMFEQAGFDRCEYHNLTAGVVAVHRGYKY